MATGVTGRSQSALNKAHKEMMRNLANEIDKIQGKTLQGLTMAAMKIKGEALPLTPKDTGNLRNSSYVIWEDSGVKGNNKNKAGDDVIQAVKESQNIKKVAIGYGASYAIYVHEINKNYVVGSWKYLMKAIQRNQKEIVNIIVAYARKP